MKNIIVTIKAVMPTLAKRGIALAMTMVLLNVSFASAEPTTGINGFDALKDEAAVTAETSFLPNSNCQKVSVSMYNALPEQTDDTPFITANGDDLRDPDLGLTAARNGAKFDEEFYIEELGMTVRINDRMNKRYGSDHMDIYTLKKSDALRFGRQTLTVCSVEA